MCDSTAALCPSIADQRNSPGCRDQRRPGGHRSDGSIAWQSRSSLSGRRFEHRDDSEIIRYRPATRKPSQGLPYTRVKVEQTHTCSSIFSLFDLHIAWCGTAGWSMPMLCLRSHRSIAIRPNRHSECSTCIASSPTAASLRKARGGRLPPPVRIGHEDGERVHSSTTYYRKTG